MKTALLVREPSSSEGPELSKVLYIGSVLLFNFKYLARKQRPLHELGEVFNNAELNNAATCRHLPHGFYEKQLQGRLRPLSFYIFQELTCNPCIDIQGRFDRKMVRFPSGRQEKRVQLCVFLALIFLGFLPSRPLSTFAGFFSQFGDVKRLKVSRNKKTGRAKHYAFVEFRSPQVAAIAAEAMNGYMMFTQKLDCHVLAASDVHKDLFKGTSRGFKKIPWAKIEQTRHNKPRTVKEQVRVCQPSRHCIQQSVPREVLQGPQTSRQYAT